MYTFPSYSTEAKLKKLEEEQNKRELELVKETEKKTTVSDQTDRMVASV